jgi:hypothetical protein
MRVQRLSPSLPHVQNQPQLTPHHYWKFQGGLMRAKRLLRAVGFASRSWVAATEGPAHNQETRSESSMPAC